MHISGQKCCINNSLGLILTEQLAGVTAAQRRGYKLDPSSSGGTLLKSIVTLGCSCLMIHFESPSDFTATLRQNLTLLIKRCYSVKKSSSAMMHFTDGISTCAFTHA